MSILSADKWLASVLEGDVTLQGMTNHQQVYQGTAPDAATYPFIQILFVDGSNVANATADKIMVSETWLVKVIGMGNDLTALEPVVERIATLLHKASGTGVIGCAQERPFRYKEVDAGVVYQHLGHYYTVFTQ